MKGLSSRGLRRTATLAVLLMLALSPALADCVDTRDMRLVSVGGALTEIVYALGAEDRLVGRDSTSVYPPEALALPDVGYLRALPAEGVLSLEPTLVIAEDDAGPPAVLEQIRLAGTPLEIVSDDHSMEGVARKVETVAALLGCSDEGVALAATIRAEAAALAEAVAAAPSRPRVLFLLNIGQGAPMGGGANTSADGIIALAGGSNAAAGMEGYKPLSAEAAIAAQPEVILMAAGSVEALGGREAVLALPQVAHTEAGANGRLVVMDGLLLLGFGPRTVEAARALAAELHGEAFAAAMP